MLRPCINYGALDLTLPLEEQVKTLHDAGFRCVDFNIEIFLTGQQIQSGEFSELFKKDIDEILEFFKPYKELFEKYEIEVTQAHAPFQLYVDGRDDINELCYDACVKSLAICNFLNCKYVVLHPITLSFTHDREYERKVNIEYYSRLIPAAKKYGVMICLENMFAVISRHVTEGVCSDCAETNMYIDKLNELAGEELFGFCFDLGHMTLLGKNIRESLVTLGKRVKLLHIHDNDAIQDNHGLPFVYARNWGQSHVTDWNGFIEGLRRINYRGELDFEVSTGCKLLPPGLRAAGYKFTYAAAEYVAKEILKD